MGDTDFIKTDILVIGSGLAGLRCGISALGENPAASVLIVTKGAGPVGSSFTNINNALGIQVCLTDEEKELFVKRAVAISRPGSIDADLTKIMVEESEKCFRFLINHHIEFNTGENGRINRYPGCFHPETASAFVFKNLANVFHLLKSRYDSLSGNYIENHSAVHLLKGINKDESTVSGGVFLNETTGRFAIINARTTILASGGVTPLFKWNTGGLSLSGYSPALLKQAGAKIVNAKFHQFLWYNPVTSQPIDPLDFLQKGASIRIGEKIIEKIPKKILSLIPKRKTHVPAAYGFPDTAIEKYLLSLADENGVVTFILDNRQEIPAVLCTHAWNGGAQIDQNGWTGVPGLYACGECAGGMHGANRIGGAMILASQVFGNRAGIHSAQNFNNYPLFSQKECTEASFSAINCSTAPLDINYLNQLKEAVYKAGLHNLFGRRNNFHKMIKTELQDRVNPEDKLLALLFESALIIS